jgi:hypothetical protein
MAQLGWTFSDVWTKVSEFLGTGSSPTGTALSRAKDITYRGYLSFLFPVRSDTGEVHVWSFLKKQSTIVTQSGTWKYALPTDYRELVGSIEYEESSMYNTIEQRPLSALRNMRALGQVSAGPSWCSVAWGRYSPSTGQQRELCFYPTPDQAYRLKYTYVFDPPKPTNDTDVFVGGPVESEVVLQCALAVAEFQEDNTLGTQNQRATALIERLMRKDEQQSPDSVGIVSDRGLHVISPYALRHLWVPTGTVTVYGHELS